MGKCNACGNMYDKCMEIKKDGNTYLFDCFECAIQKLAPNCQNCDCKIIGHGVEESGTFYCCASCAKAGGSSGFVDRI